MNDDRMIAVDLGWLADFFATLEAAKQAEAIGVAQVYTAEYCPSGATPFNVIAYLYEGCKSIDEDRFGPDIEVNRIVRGPRVYHPDFLRLIESAYAQKEVTHA